MVNVKDTFLYDDLIKEFNYSFGSFFVFDGYIIAEINEGVCFSWEYGEKFVKDLTSFLGVYNLDSMIYISNRINEYSVVPSDWLKFLKSYSLKSYCIVSEAKVGKLSLLVESLFYPKKIKRFRSTYTAVNWVKNGLVGVA